MSPHLHQHVRSLIAAREAELRVLGKVLIYGGGTLALLLILGSLSYAFMFGPPGGIIATPEFIVTPEDTLLTVSDRLEKEGLVKHAPALRFAYAFTRTDLSLRPGGYVLSPSMDAIAVSRVLGKAPYLAWIVIPEAKRKEEIGELLSEALSWSDTEREEWIEATASSTAVLSDGTYFADTYLIPSDQPPAAIAARLRDRFVAATAPFASEAKTKEEEFTDVLILASLIEREAAKNDKKLVAGILKNRLDRGMLLQVDATLQYMEGAEGKWWPAPDPDDKDADSPYNTYLYEGLPPGPIVTPSLASIEAALDPQVTNCLYYLHDNYGRIHCATNYQAHLSNVRRYLR
jgi:UPF0755 protein